MVVNSKSYGKIMGKAGKSYTVEQLQRLLQEFGVVFTKQNKKIDLIAKLRKYSLDHPEITSKERIKILNSPLHIQHIRWQILDENGHFRLHAYPPQLEDLLEQSAKKAVIENNEIMVKRNARCCKSCETMKGELEFPTSMGICCYKSSKSCRSCIEKYISTKVDGAFYQKYITCMLCAKPMAKMDVKLLTTMETFDKFCELN